MTLRELKLYSLIDMKTNLNGSNKGMKLECVTVENIKHLSRHIQY